MKIRKQELPALQELALGGLRLLDLDDHLRPGEHLGTHSDDRRARLPIRIVVHADALPRARFHDHLVPVRGELAHAFRREAHAMLQDLDFPRNADTHVFRPLESFAMAPDRGVGRVTGRRKLA